MGCFLIALLWALFGIAGSSMLAPFNKQSTGFLLGLFLGPIGLVIAWVMRSNLRGIEENRRHQEQLAAVKATSAPAPTDPSNLHEDAQKREERDCPYCAERILAKARVCKHCQREIEPLH